MEMRHALRTPTPTRERKLGVSASVPVSQLVRSLRLRKSELASGEFSASGSLQRVRFCAGGKAHLRGKRHSVLLDASRSSVSLRDHMHAPKMMQSIQLSLRNHQKYVTTPTPEFVNFVILV